MTDLAPVAVAEMLIRKPVAEVFEAFVDPAITSKFWFTHGSGRLDGGSGIEWEWRMYGFSVPVTVKNLVKDKKIVVEWNDPPTTVEWTFTPMDKGTFVSIRNFGFAGRAEEQVKTAVDSAGGFSFVLAGAKAWLEQGVTLGLVADRHPKGLPSE
ncbi:SRPBCC family protein [Mesorhizobium sp. LHD-90]|uniref:SRPBCC family protein n=1 Tax=Mesorhizobium sp. LHD-90 TaxID=3071414 RepID=UPI0027DF2038|nr:SRPBCC family protein [Mesorhizobium sp. LHD-90]MDQ6438330.1 SRPBCC family protein [Mesorhizobium sp. LHD-90]